MGECVNPSRRCTGGRSARARSSGGFTLLEVLMAVLILGLGLLGLGALLPAVVKQQQRGADDTFGALALKAAEEYLRANTQFNDPDFWTRMASDQNSPIPLDGSWLPLSVEGDDRPLSPDNALPGATVMAFTRTGNPSVLEYRRIPLADRLYPADASGVSQPQMVWDLAIRRRAPRAVNPPYSRESVQVEVAVFVRRIGGQIVVPRNDQGSVSLFRSFQSGGSAFGRWPVSMTINDGLPRQDGRRTIETAYAAPVVVPVIFDPGNELAAGSPTVTVRDRIRVDTTLPGRTTGPFGQASVNIGAANSLNLVGQSGQRLVDNLGNVFTVQAVDRDSNGGVFVRVTPPVPLGVRRTNDGEPQSMTSVVLVPTPPVAMTTFTVNP